SWSIESRSWCLSSASDRLRNFSAALFISLPLVSCARDELRLQRQFVRREAHGLKCRLARDAFHLEQDPAGANDTDPMVESTIAAAHADFSRLLGDRLVREQAHPHLAATLDEAGHGDTAGFDLPVSDPTRLHRLQPEIPEAQLRAAPGLAGHAALLLL